MAGQFGGVRSYLHHKLSPKIGACEQGKGEAPTMNGGMRATICFVNTLKVQISTYGICQRSGVHSRNRDRIDSQTARRSTPSTRQKSALMMRS